MEPKIINFTVDNQMLVNQTGSICLASGTVEYVGAHFELGENWSGFDSIISAWANFRTTKIAVLDPDGNCQVPTEVLAQKGTVLVNLVGSKVENNVVVERLTTCKIEAATIGCDANLTGSETVPVTPSQFEQFVAIVIAEVQKVTGMSAVAETLPPGSEAYARYEDGVLYLGIPEGAQGEAGADGADGNGISSITLNADYTLTISYTDGTSTTVGPIRGAEGPEGPRGPQGEPGQDGVTPVFSIGNVETLPAGSDAEASITGTPEAPVLNLRIPKGDPGEVTMETLEQILPTDTASGAIASFPDGSDLFPAKSVLVNIDPVQDLNGYNSPWPPGGGANKFDYAKATFVAAVPAYGLTISVSGSTVRVQGTATVTYASMAFAITTNYANESLSGKGYICQAMDASGTHAISGAWGFRTESEKSYAISLANVNEGDNVDVSFKISVAETSQTAWSPYSNICPITGWTGAEAQRAGKNLFDPQYRTNSGSNVYAYKNVGYMLRAGETYTYSASESASGIYFVKYGVSPTQNLALKYNSKSVTYTPTEDVLVYLDAYYNPPPSGGTASIIAQLELGSTATAYEPYQGETYDVTWQDEAGTVYGCTVDIVSGVLTVDRINGYINKVSNIYGTWDGTKGAYWYTTLTDLALPRIASRNAGLKCDRLILSTNVNASDTNGVITIYDNGILRWVDPQNMAKTLAEYRTILATDPIQIVYELAEPVEYQLTEQEVDILLGQNNIWANTGDTSVTYKADIQRYIEKKLA